MLSAGFNFCSSIGSCRTIESKKYPVFGMWPLGGTDMSPCRIDVGVAVLIAQCTLKSSVTRTSVPSLSVKGFQPFCCVPNMLHRGAIPTTSIPSASRSASSISPSTWYGSTDLDAITLITQYRTSQACYGRSVDSCDKRRAEVDTDAVGLLVGKRCLQPFATGHRCSLVRLVHLFITPYS